MEKNSKKCQNLTKNSQNFDRKIEIRKRCKGVHCVDLGESFPTNIYLQNLASIQPRTSPRKTIPDTPIPTPPPPLKPTLNYETNMSMSCCQQRCNKLLTTVGKCRLRKSKLSLNSAPVAGTFQRREPLGEGGERVDELEVLELRRAPSQCLRAAFFVEFDFSFSMGLHFFWDSRKYRMIAGSQCILQKISETF